MTPTEGYFRPGRDRLRNVGCVCSLFFGGLGLAVLAGVEFVWLPRRCPISGIPMGADLLLVAGGLLALALLWPGVYRPIDLLVALAVWPVHRLLRSRSSTGRS